MLGFVYQYGRVSLGIISLTFNIIIITIVVIVTVIIVVVIVIVITVIAGPVWFYAVSWSYPGSAGCSFR